MSQTDQAAKSRASCLSEQQALMQGAAQLPSKKTFYIRQVANGWIVENQNYNGGLLGYSDQANNIYIAATLAEAAEYILKFE